MILPALAHLAVPVADLSPHPMNPNEGDVGAIAVQLEAHGQHTPIVIQDGTGVILAGNHTWMAARSLGWETIAAVPVQVDDARALELLVGDNRPFRLASDDPERLADVLHALADAGALDGSGYDPADLDELARRQLADTTPPPTFEVPVPTITIKVPPGVFEGWAALVAARAPASEGEVLADLIAHHTTLDAHAGT